MPNRHKEETYDSEEDKVGVVLVFMDLCNDIGLASANLLGGSLDEVLRDISGIGKDLAIVGYECGESTSRVLSDRRDEQSIYAPVGMGKRTILRNSGLKFSPSTTLMTTG